MMCAQSEPRLSSKWAILFDMGCDPCCWRWMSGTLVLVFLAYQENTVLWSPNLQLDGSSMTSCPCSAGSYNMTSRLNRDLCHMWSSWPQQWRLQQWIQVCKLHLQSLCPKWIFEKRVQQVKAERNISFIEVHKIVSVCVCQLIPLPLVVSCSRNPDLFYLFGTSSPG